MTKEEAIKKIKKSWDFIGTNEKEVLETLIPELKESEDERIRKALMWFVERFPYDRLNNNGVSAKEALAWLEKQGEKPQVDGFDAEFNALLKKYEHLPNDEMVECLKFYLRVVQGEQKPKWTEEDESKVEDVIYFLDTAKVHYASTKALDDCIEWLKSLKQRMEQ